MTSGSEIAFASAEALADLVHEMNMGLGTILSHAELLLVYREDARDKRTAAIGSILGICGAYLFALVIRSSVPAGIDLRRVSSAAARRSRCWRSTRRRSAC